MNRHKRRRTRQLTIYAQILAILIDPIIEDLDPLHVRNYVWNMIEDGPCTRLILFQLVEKLIHSQFFDEPVIGGRERSAAVTVVED